MGPHPETDLVGYLGGELDGGARRRVEQHLEHCARCRARAKTFEHLLAELAATAPAPPVVDWRQWREELGDRLHTERRQRPQPTPPRKSWRPVPFALAATLAGLLLFIAVHGVVRDPHAIDLAAVDEALRAQRLEMLGQAPLLETLELLEDLEVIGALDRLAEAR